MDCTRLLAAVKQRPGFADNVGMTLVHNGTVRAWSLNGGARVACVKVQPDHQRIKEICREFETWPGIFCIEAQAAEGTLLPGEDLLILVVAGDIREHVKAAFAALLDTIKEQAVVKQEILLEQDDYSSVHLE